MDWQLICVAVSALCAGGVLGFSIGKAYGINIGWHSGYQSAWAFYRRKSARQHDSRWN